MRSTVVRGASQLTLRVGNGLQASPSKRHLRRRKQRRRKRRSRRVASSGCARRARRRSGTARQSGHTARRCLTRLVAALPPSGQMWMLLTAAVRPLNPCPDLGQLLLAMNVGKCIVDAAPRLRCCPAPARGRVSWLHPSSRCCLALHCCCVGQGPVLEP